jgi:hypothetical protein
MYLNKQTGAYMLTLKEMRVEEDFTAVDFACNFTVTTAGDGLWDCEAGRQVNVTGITVITNAGDEDRVYVSVNVTHDSTWDIYTDSAFSDAISNAVGFSVNFTEQGMQEDNYASMEA